ncbi:GntR family transcriptional regulator [Desulfitobacterium sp. LBE]|uniref:GntR family transcriptional regulator n=1 Tax=Desulfitobacterium hafniense TaxID=49338 RepID=A0A098B0F3_DESHA|nr:MULTISPECIES: FadR/GntR family transcriptional regulator [Desulfitobacterium]KTE89895.1 GntR family transcriptional regulator [Desulfitobacterium hafniense]TWH60788.1 GntR family transcriptional regulator [Desulfitobacterium sp. LBE]CDX02344.1 HTH-type transcriptional regulator LutR [Desulfitobacterium hafniense]
MELKPIKTRKIYEEIVEQIRELVARGELKPGDRLPSERDLVERLKVSRASIREALSALELMGLLEVRSGEGTFVRKLRSESVVAPLAWMLTMEKGTVLELLEIRKILEVQAVGMAAERAESEDIRELSAALDRLQDDLHSPTSDGSSDHRFHYAITRATKNKIMIRLMDTISDLMKYSLKASRSKLYEGKYTPALLFQEHKKIYEAIVAKDVEMARNYMLTHLTGVEEEILKGFTEENEAITPIY